MNFEKNKIHYCIVLVCNNPMCWIKSNKYPIKFNPVSKPVFGKTSE